MFCIFYSIVDIAISVSYIFILAVANLMMNNTYPAEMIIPGKIHAYKQKTILSFFLINFRKSHKASGSMARFISQNS